MTEFSINPKENTIKQRPSFFIISPYLLKLALKSYMTPYLN